MTAAENKEKIDKLTGQVDDLGKQLSDALDSLYALGVAVVATLTVLESGRGIQIEAGKIRRELDA